jgi:lipopolysaccharide export system protein LptC
MAKLRTQSLFPLAVLTLLAALTFWLERATQVGEGAPDGKLRHDPDFIVSDFTVRKFDLQGALQYALVAQRMVHYPDDESTEVESPHLTYFSRPPIMRISSRRANISKDGNEVVLIDDVRAVREPSAKDPEMVLLTTELSIYPDQEFAATDKAVKLIHGKSVLNGVGMELDNKAQLYRILGNATGTLHRTREK